MIAVAEALSRLLALLEPVGVETVPLHQASGRVLRAPVVSRRVQPPFDASAMDGYAVRAADAVAGAALRVIGEAPAGRRYAGALGAGEAVRIFTGAPMPDGADAVLIQENAAREGAVVTVTEAPEQGAWVRPRGLDFNEATTLAAPRRLRSGDVALIAAMNAPEITVSRRPRIALIPTGDELVEPGAEPGPDQIVSSNNYGLAALLAARGAHPLLPPIARDTPDALRASLEQAAAEADLLVTLGGASVGDHDHVRSVVGDDALAFYKVAMRPGKPLMAGRVGETPLIGLPGNPVSAMVCGHIFIAPALDRLLGLASGARPRSRAPLAAPLGPGGPREHYMRARRDADGRVAAFEAQDSSMLSILAAADALIVQPPHAAAQAAGEQVEIISLSD